MRKTTVSPTVFRAALRHCLLEALVEENSFLFFVFQFVLSGRFRISS